MYTLLCIFFVLTGTLTGCSKPEPTQAEFVLGTVCTITLYDAGKPKVYRAIFDRLVEIEKRMSVGMEGTDVYRVNEAAGIEAVVVHPTVFEVIERAVDFAKLSGGAFDPTVGPLVSLWGIGKDNPRLPEQAEIDAALPLINWRDIDLDREKSTVFLKRPGMALDLGAIAKGYAADEAAAIIKKAKVPRAIIDLGGNILVYGEKPDGTPWRVGIQNPLETRGAYIGIVEAREKTVVTSGVYERYFESDGVRYHHILSPALGYPVQNGLLSVTIIASRSIDADALSTSVFALGYKEGRALIDSLEDVAGIFVFDDLSIRLTKGASFRLTDDKYQIVSD
ncbi:MAG: FAD:protein FMN transferase [Treponema sp.]|jgi:thiamine biosynthesis lipoprotein|nr:FAD:protein FMN transferase [Treponema sp.]